MCTENINLIKVEQNHREFHVKTAVSFAVASDIRSPQKCSLLVVSTCQGSRGGTNIRRTRHNVTLHVHCLSCVKLCKYQHYHLHLLPLLLLILFLLRRNSPCRSPGSISTEVSRSFTITHTPDRTPLNE